MIDAKSIEQMTDWLDMLRHRFSMDAPVLLPLFETYAEEALFGRSFIAEDLDGLAGGSCLLEVGAGAMLLSCQLVCEGFKVCALEPTGSGFSHFDQMRDIILQAASEAGNLPEIINLPAESLEVRNRFDYAFSVNVMEHVADVSAVINKVCASLRKGGSYHFVCPNYLFPYEPHFNMPTLFSKRLTEWVLRRRIYGYDKIPDPAGTWASLNWINVIQVRRLVGRMRGVRLWVKRDIMKMMFERVLTDERFSSRRSNFFRRMIQFVVSIHLHHLLKFLPAGVQPMMDCRIQKTSR